MKKIFTFAVVTIFALTMFISAPGITEARTVRVKSYYKPSTGTYVSPSYRTAPNKTKLDNYSTKGNYNPYSGKKGSVRPY